MDLTKEGSCSWFGRANDGATLQAFSAAGLNNGRTLQPRRATMMRTIAI
jgi:hypothetical protein